MRSLVSFSAGVLTLRVLVLAAGQRRSQVNPLRRCLPLLAALLLLMPWRAALADISVVNPSFETLPNGGLPIPCGGSCAYNIGPIPGWNDSGLSGQLIMGGFDGNPNAIDGSVLAFTDNSVIWQNVGTAVAGTKYKLQVDVLHRTDFPLFGVVELEVGATTVSAPIVDNGPGTWSNWTASYTATPADAGGTITILLSASENQGDFDNVRLDGTSPVPEPRYNLLMLLLGTGLLGLRKWTRMRSGRGAAASALPAKNRLATPV